MHDAAELESRMARLSTAELRSIVDSGEGEFVPEALEAARRELTRREAEARPRPAAGQATPEEAPRKGSRWRRLTGNLFSLVACWSGLLAAQAAAEAHFGVRGEPPLRFVGWAALIAIALLYAARRISVSPPVRGAVTAASLWALTGLFELVALYRAGAPSELLLAVGSVVALALLLAGSLEVRYRTARMWRGTPDFEVGPDRAA